MNEDDDLFMLEKTRIIFNEDVKEMWIAWNRFRRSKAQVIETFQKFYLINGTWKTGFRNGMFIFTLDNDKEWFSVEEAADIFHEEVEGLRSMGFDVSYDQKDSMYRFYISMDNLVEAITEDYGGQL